MPGNMLKYVDYMLATLSTMLNGNGMLKRLTMPRSMLATLSLMLTMPCLHASKTQLNVKNMLTMPSNFLQYSRNAY